MCRVRYAGLTWIYLAKILSLYSLPIGMKIASSEKSHLLFKIRYQDAQSTAQVLTMVKHEKASYGTTEPLSSVTGEVSNSAKFRRISMYILL